MDSYKKTIMLNKAGMPDIIACKDCIFLSKPDIKNKVVIQKIHDIEKPYEYSNWFLISKDYFGGELLEFLF